MIKIKTTYKDFQNEIHAEIDKMHRVVVRLYAYRNDSHGNRYICAFPTTGILKPGETDSYSDCGITIIFTLQSITGEYILQLVGEEWE